MRIDINSKELKDYTSVLKRMKKSDLPLAVRGTLNNLAFEYKQKSLPNEWDRQFIVRHKTFLKSHSGVNKCDNTFDINRMKSVAGTLDKDLAGRQLEMHENTGKIQDRAVQQNPSRVGGSIHNRVRKTLRYRRFAQAVARGRTGAVIHGINEKGGAFLITKAGRVVWRNNKKPADSQDAWKTIYTAKDTVSLKKNPFNEASAMSSMRSLERIYEQEFKKRLAKYK